ncbi:DUF2231 domain-containing protein [Tessaracoccus sp. SD287]|uniref:DUF2231 domain-containing protein n=1 Tax=Tessaracoccus sp. SD287 TaxID=2782008 RepID=UPI001A95DDEE|nr:DUF2231 domain-containing protein [Tessaracoccus sp. SD287]MBO1030102.1 DUF2231 domain-containing protein [Tessaracoccus sp. SD287]
MATVSGSEPVSTETPNAYARLLRRIEEAAILDRVVDQVDPLAGKLTSNDRMRGVLHGDVTGIPLHVIVTDLPLGAWWMSIFLDLFPQQDFRAASQRLVGLGLVGAVPTALAGWAEWSLKDQPNRRVGIVHAVGNEVAAVIYLASWVARRRGRHDVGVQLNRVGAVFLLAAAMLGGHMGSTRRTASPPGPSH